MPNLLEDPTAIIAFGIIAEAVLGVMLFCTGRGVILWAMGGVLLLVLGGVAIEWLVVTDRERVEATIYGGAAALEANREEELLQLVAKDAAELRSLIHWAMQRAEFTGVKINHLEITLNRLTSPPTAKAQIKGLLSFEDRLGQSPYKSYPIEMTLDLRQEGQRWIIFGYKLKDDPRAR